MEAESAPLLNRAAGQNRLAQRNSRKRLARPRRHTHRQLHARAAIEPELPRQRLRRGVSFEAGPDAGNPACMGCLPCGGIGYRFLPQASPEESDPPPARYTQNSYPGENRSRHMRTAENGPRAHFDPLHPSRNYHLRLAGRGALFTFVLFMRYLLSLLELAVRGSASVSATSHASSRTCCPTCSPSRSRWPCSSASCSASAGSRPTAKPPPCARPAWACTDVPAHLEHTSSRFAWAAGLIELALHRRRRMPPRLLRLQFEEQRKTAPRPRSKCSRACFTKT